MPSDGCGISLVVGGEAAVDVVVAVSAAIPALVADDAPVPVLDPVAHPARIPIARRTVPSLLNFPDMVTTSI